MASKIPKRRQVDFILNHIRERGGVTTANSIMQAFERHTGRQLRSFATFLSDARKLGADIRYDTKTDRVCMLREPDRSRPAQREIHDLADAVVHAEEWLSRGLRGAIQTQAVALLVQHARETNPALPRHRDNVTPGYAACHLPSQRLFD